MIVQIFNASRYTKQVFLNSKTLPVRAKHMIRLEVTPEEYERVCATPSIEVTLVPDVCVAEETLERDFGPQDDSPILASERGIDDEVLLQLFDIRREVEVLREAVETVYSDIDTLHTDIAFLRLESEHVDVPAIQDINKVLREFRKRITALEEGGVAGGPRVAASELLNVEANPQEARRSMFEKIVQRNKEIRES